MNGGPNASTESSTRRKPRLPERPLQPLNALTCIAPQGVITLPRNEVTVDAVGWKAYGLSSMPVEWVPKFLLIDAECVKDEQSRQTLTSLLGQGLSQAGIADGLVKIRSSGTAETIEYRGRLESATCRRNEIVTAIERCIESRTTSSLPGRIHWIVQENVEAQRQGHLSNERRVSKEKRDWVAEVELKEGALGYSIPIAVRRWRDGDRIASHSLGCTSELEISFCLKRVALWAERLLSRMHFEWVWSGEAIRVVQADIADSHAGVDPRSLIPDKISVIQIGALKAFSPASDTQYGRYTKLRNARMYRQLGYTMPTFYVLDSSKHLASILSGTVPVAVERDLAELTKRPLILRTDGTDIPGTKREMLPRSDELRTLEEARAWLLRAFKHHIEQADLQQSSLCLIGHHFIPSLASAWARAEPQKRFVRIEGLWGLPEGLYWYAHDTYEVDTRELTLNAKDTAQTLDYDSWERARYKGTFIAPDSSGKWIPYQPKPPFDWRSTINRKQWLFEIARTTRLIAEREKFPVAAMWFIGNHPAVTSHAVLPWFHNRSELQGAPKAAPRRKLTGSGDFRVHRAVDWQSLQQQVAAHKRVERVIVEPTDCELVRNSDFASKLAEFAASNNIVIELAGGVLTHAYYILHRQGALVQCTDLFGAEEEVVEYNKLVRDRIPSIIEARGERVEVVRLGGDALTSALRQKLVEEALEALDAKSGDDLLAELADVEEVISGLRHALKLTKVQIEAQRLEKLRRRGGFQRGYMLTRTLTPHSLAEKQPAVSEITLGLQPTPTQSIILSPSDIPSPPTYRRPDLRQVEEELEKLFVFETEIKRMTDLAKTVDFSLPLENGSSRNFSLTVEIRRRGASLRSSVRLRVRPAQLTIDFPDSQLKLDFPK